MPASTWCATCWRHSSRTARAGVMWRRSCCWNTSRMASWAKNRRRGCCGIVCKTPGACPTAPGEYTSNEFATTSWHDAWNPLLRITALFRLLLCRRLPSLFTRYRIRMGATHGVLETQFHGQGTISSVARTAYALDVDLRLVCAWILL